MDNVVVATGNAVADSLSAQLDDYHVWREGLMTALTDYQDFVERHGQSRGIADLPTVHAEVEQSRLVAFEESPSVAEVARALNALGVSPRDIIAIFQALKEAGALRAQIKII